MAAIDAIVFAVAAGFAFGVLVVVIVTIGIHQEERNWSLNSGKIPSLIAQMARIVLGCDIRRAYDRPRSRRDKVGHGTSTRR